VVDADILSRGYTIPWAARQMGAQTFLHISFPRHMSYETYSRRRAIMEVACMDTYVFGQGYLGTTSLKIPDKYFNIR
jgi:hypothetical protein